MRKELRLLLGGLGIGVTVGAAAYALMKLSDENFNQDDFLETDVAVPFDFFLNDSVFVDDVNGQMLAEWIRSKERSKDSVCIVAYPDKEVFDKFNITGCPDNLDPEKNLLMFLLDAETSQIYAARLISFCTMSETVSELFCGKKFFVLAENTDRRNNENNFQ